MEKYCEICGSKIEKEWRKDKNHIRKNPLRFCSPSCSASFSTKKDTFTEKKSAVCVSCGENIKINKRARLDSALCFSCKKERKKEREKLGIKGPPRRGNYGPVSEETRKKISEGVKRAHAEGRMRYDHLDAVRNWSAGKTTETDSRILRKYNPFEYGSLSNNDTRKKILVQERGHKCEMCGLGVWQGKEIVLELDHINGDNADQHRENLRLLCPNCHSQTPTWRGRNVRGSKWKNPVDEKTYVEALKSSPSIAQALAKIGLTPKGGNYTRAKALIEKYEIGHLS